MATQEIYIRNESETEARGPFTFAQLADLADAGQVDGKTLMYNATTEQWVALETDAEVMAGVFPPKRKLTLRNKEIATLNKANDRSKPISVDDMLAAAEGRTTDTKGKADPELAMARAARVGMLGGILALLLAAGGEILPGSAALMALDVEKLLAQPLVLLGVADVVLAVLLGLGMTSLYPLIRFRAALGFGLIGFMLYAQGQHEPLLHLGAGCLGLYSCTVFVRLLPALLAALAAAGGMGMLSWFLLNN